MKKVLSLVLAVMMVVGMTTVAFAATKGEKAVYTFEAGGSYLFGTPSAAVVGPPAVIAGATRVETIAGALPVAADIDVFVDGTWGPEQIPATAYTVGAIAAKDGKITVELTFAKDGKYTVAIDKDIPAVLWTVDPLNPANNAFQAVAAPGLKPAAQTITVGAGTTPVNPGTPSTSDVVPSKWKITGFSDNAGANWNSQKSEIGIGEEKDELKITADMFTWEDKDKNVAVVGTDFPANAKLRSSQLSNVGVRRVYQKGTSGTIKSVELKDSDSLVQIKTVKFYAKTGSTDVELKVALTYKSKTSDIIVANYSFTMENSTEYIEEGQNQAYSYGNVIQKAEATVRDVEFEGDEDGIVYATKTVVKGQKYYFNVDATLSDDDAKIVADNPEVDSIYTVYQVNMANSAVKFKNLDREYFVYDAEGKLLGTTKDTKLPLASKYILTTAKVSFGGSDVEETPAEESEAPTEPEAPPMGGGEVVETPNTYNPNTGR